MRTSLARWWGLRLVQQAVPPKPSHMGMSGDHGQGNDERLNLVKYHLRRELPVIHQATPTDTLALCHPNVIFRDNIHGITLQGKRTLQLSLMAFRQSLPLLVSQPSCQVLWLDRRASQQLHARWRIVGFSRTSLTGQIWLDAYTVFHVKNTGLIEKIELDNVMPRKSEDKERARHWPFAYSSSA
ncbi:hypothetical protein PTSG_02534 [Salpingoeca rosetta]|uniref:SnoaL-like domain-containing protein n=1 Tax=Salpingoeca rosetta (strain ATCC 50818 / BSB-021) TaxID=946362 RepID=F2U2G8_SALR5|nr:uncharacterized protein PTSG_02534 [Salpingoeca rosetta]EGD81820.1 hypothetical protein PTSG_02534 [Salpingoeca rosetta]|eukprot:XP_004997024.1 hypothetical protein PTSG_02534 [Salpingoeca rosetta]